MSDGDISEGEGDIMLEWPDFSDGTSNKWPGPPYVRADSSSMSIGWLQKTGQVIATVSQLPHPERYRMRGWPSAYAVFSLTRGDGPKSDYYLCGGPKKYRSAQEFQEHAVWLYFSGNPPTDYQALLGSPPKKARLSGSQGTTPLPKKRPGASNTPVPRPQTATIRGFEPLKKAHPVKRVTFQDATPPAAATPSKPSQLRRIGFNRPVPSLLTLAPKRTRKTRNSYPIREQINRQRRTYRIGELVWCIVEPNLLSKDTVISIDQWPGIIEAYRVKKSVLSADAITEDELYQVKLLAVKDEFLVPGSRITPYKGFKPLPALISLIQSLPAPLTPQLPSQLYHFHQNVPYILVQHRENDEEPPENPFLQATAAYAVALQNAARLALTWGFFHPQIQESDSADWDRRPDMDFTALWWGPELLYVGEMALMIPNRAQLAQHPTTAAYVQYNKGDEKRAVILQIKYLEARSTSKEPIQSRAFALGILYELAPLLSDTVPDPVETMPKQTAPFGMMWKRMLPPGLEICADIKLLSGRYYDDVGALPSNESGEALDTASAVLQGLGHGVYAPGTTPTSYHNTRGQMCRAAKKESVLDLEQYWGIQLELA